MASYVQSLPGVVSQPIAVLTGIPGDFMKLATAFVGISAVTYAEGMLMGGGADLVDTAKRGAVMTLNTYILLKLLI